MRKAKTTPITEGTTFGKWTTIENENSKYVKCQCVCGKIKYVYAFHLRRGNSTSCGNTGCVEKRGRRAKYTVDRVPIGTVFGKWLVIGEPVHIKSGKQLHLAVECQCECGTKAMKFVHHLVNKTSKGCYNCRTFTTTKPKEPVNDQEI